MVNLDKLNCGIWPKTVGWYSGRGYWMGYIHWIWYSGQENIFGLFGLFSLETALLDGEPLVPYHSIRWGTFGSLSYWKIKELYLWPKASEIPFFISGQRPVNPWIIKGWSGFARLSLETLYKYLWPSHEGRKIVIKTLF